MNRRGLGEIADTDQFSVLSDQAQQSTELVPEQLYLSDRFLFWNASPEVRNAFSSLPFWVVLAVS